MTEHLTDAEIEKLEVAASTWHTHMNKRFERADQIMSNGLPALLAEVRSLREQLAQARAAQQAAELDRDRSASAAVNLRHELLTAERALAAEQERVQALLSVVQAAKAYQQRNYEYMAWLRAQPDKPDGKPHGEWTGSVTEAGRVLFAALDALAATEAQP